MSSHTPDPDNHGPRADHTQEDPHARPPGHERRIDRDINLRSIGLTVGGLAVGTVLAMILMWWMHQALLSNEIARDPRPPGLPEAREAVVPGGPRLQASPERELEQFRAEENALLASYGWKDQAAGVVHIPVDRAMEVLVEQGRAAQSMVPDAAAGDGNEAVSPASLAAGGGTTATVPAEPAGGAGAGVMAAPQSGAGTAGEPGTTGARGTTGAPGPGGAGGDGASAEDGRE